MKHLVLCSLIVFALGGSSKVSAESITVGASSTYNETGPWDTSGDVFTLTNTSDLLSGVQISSVSFSLSPGLLFDTATNERGDFSSVFSSDFMALTSISGGTVNSSTFDGSNLLTLNFTDFDPGETFSFSIDVDDQTGSDKMRRLVTGLEFSDTLFSVTFMGSILGNSRTLSNTFTPVSSFMANSSISEGVGRASDISEGVGRVLPNPEPSSWLLLLTGATGLGLIRFARNRAKQNSVVPNL